MGRSLFVRLEVCLYYSEKFDRNKEKLGQKFGLVQLVTHSENFPHKAPHYDSYEKKSKISKNGVRIPKPDS